MSPAPMENLLATPQPRNLPRGTPGTSLSSVRNRRPSASPRPPDWKARAPSSSTATGSRGRPMGTSALVPAWTPFSGQTKDSSTAAWRKKVFQTPARPACPHREGRARLGRHSTRNGLKRIFRSMVTDAGVQGPLNTPNSPSRMARDGGVHVITCYKSGRPLQGQVFIDCTGRRRSSLRPGPGQFTKARKRARN